MKMEFSAGGVVYRHTDGKVEFILIQDTNSEWTFPKGHIEKGERPEDAAIRETEEEIGLKKLKIIELLQKSDYWFKFNDELIHKFVYFYLMESADSGDPTPQLEELQAAGWFDACQAYEKVGYKEQNQAVLQKVFEKLQITCK